MRLTLVAHKSLSDLVPWPWTEFPESWAPGFDALCAELPWKNNCRPAFCWVREWYTIAYVLPDDLGNDIKIRFGMGHLDESGLLQIKKAHNEFVHPTFL